MYSPTTIRVLVIAMMAVALVFLPSTIVFSACMLPTFVAALVDRSKEKTMWITIGALNLAGTVPSWFSLWEKGNTLGAAIDVALLPNTFLIAYSFAALGWIIHHNVTPVVATMMLRRAEKRLIEIDKEQRELIRQWGDGVTSE